MRFAAPGLRLASSVTMFAMAGVALAQATLGELLDAGARKLAGDGFRTEIVDAAVSGPSRSGGSVEFVYRGDGRFSGRVAPADGRGAGVVGTWAIDANGRVCVDFALVATDRTSSSCGYFFKLGETFFASESDSDRSAAVLTRVVRR